MEQVLITGGTGLIGNHLSRKLIERGYKVFLLSTSQKKFNIPVYRWNINESYIDEEAIHSADYMIHLAGANIGEKRWTSNRKQAITDSRVKSTNLLFNAVSRHPDRLKAFISASATGFYGTITSPEIFTEEDPPATDFLGDICTKWEQAADEFGSLGIRTVKLRTGVVLAGNGGIVAKLRPLVNAGIGSPIGSGKQYMPWIHINDLCNMYIKAIEDNHMQGAFNAVAPEHTTNKYFMASMAQILSKPFWVPNVPGIFIQLAFGQMADILLKGSRISAEKLIRSGFSFDYPTLNSALKSLLVNSQDKDEKV